MGLFGGFEVSQVEYYQVIDVIGEVWIFVEIEELYVLGFDQIYVLLIEYGQIDVQCIEMVFEFVQFFGWFQFCQCFVYYVYYIGGDYEWLLCCCQFWLIEVVLMGCCNLFVCFMWQVY